MIKITQIIPINILKNMVGYFPNFIPEEFTIAKMKLLDMLFNETTEDLATFISLKIKIISYISVTYITHKQTNLYYL